MFLQVATKCPSVPNHTQCNLIHVIFFNENVTQISAVIILSDVWEQYVKLMRFCLSYERILSFSGNFRATKLFFQNSNTNTHIHGKNHYGINWDMYATQIPYKMHCLSLSLCLEMFCAHWTWTHTHENAQTHYMYEFIWPTQSGEPNRDKMHSLLNVLLGDELWAIKP